MQTMQMMDSTLEEHIEHTGGRSPASTPSSQSQPILEELSITKKNQVVAKFQNV